MNSLVTERQYRAAGRLPDDQETITYFTAKKEVIRSPGVTRTFQRTRLVCVVLPENMPFEGRLRLLDKWRPVLERCSPACPAYGTAWHGVSRTGMSSPDRRLTSCRSHRSVRPTMWRIMADESMETGSNRPFSFPTAAADAARQGMLPVVRSGACTDGVFVRLASVIYASPSPFL